MALYICGWPITKENRSGQSDWRKRATRLNGDRRTEWKWSSLLFFDHWGNLQFVKEGKHRKIYTILPFIVISFIAITPLLPFSIASKKEQKLSIWYKTHEFHAFIYQLNVEESFRQFFLPFFSFATKFRCLWSICGIFGNLWHYY